MPSSGDQASIIVHGSDFPRQYFFNRRLFANFANLNTKIMIDEEILEKVDGDVELAAFIYTFWSA